MPQTDRASFSPLPMYKLYKKGMPSVSSNEKKAFLVCITIRENKKREEGKKRVNERGLLLVAAITPLYVYSHTPIATIAMAIEARVVGFHGTQGRYSHNGEKKENGADTYLLG